MTDCYKKKYTTWQHASNDARQLRFKGRRKEEPYHCKSCKAWHVGESSIVSKKPKGFRRCIQIGAGA